MRYILITTALEPTLPTFYDADYQLMNMEAGDIQQNQDGGNIVIVKASLHNILRNPQQVDQYREVVHNINTIITATYLLIRYIFVNEYDDDDDDVFNVDEYITPAFFKECLKALQERRRVQTTNQNTIRYRALIGRHLEEFCIIYRYHPIHLGGNQSNWENYVGTQMCTAYINNAEKHTSRHLRSIINVIFNTRELNRLVRSQHTMATEKQIARAYLADISSFKDIISNANSYDEVQNRMDELEQLGDEFIEGFHLLAPILERVGNGIYHEGSLWYELVASKSVNTLYQIAKLNSQLTVLVGRPGVKIQPFPLRYSFIPKYVPFDLKGVCYQILDLQTPVVHQHYQNPQHFWNLHFNTNICPFRTSHGGKEFDGTFWTDGYGVSILKRTPGTKIGAGQTRTRGEKRKTRDERLFPYFDTIPPQQLQAYQDIVFADPNKRDLLYMMHDSSAKQFPRLLRYTSMTRRRHLGAHIYRDREKRFIKHHPQFNQIIAAQNNLLTTDSRTLSPAFFEDYVSTRSVAKEYLGPLYESSIFRKMRWRRSIGSQRDFAQLGNLIREKFGPNPLIIMGDASCTRSMRFHPPTKGVGLRYTLHRLGFRLLLLNEYNTSTSCPDCFSPTHSFRDRKSRRPWRRHLPPQRVHGLLECRHERCVAECNGQSKKWNRDLLAVLNFRRIWNAYVSGNDRPQDLRRGRLPMSMSCANVDN